MMRVTVQEFQTSEALAISDEEIPILRKRLRELADIIYDVDGVKIRARSYVGYIPVKDDLQLVVLPKIERFEDFFYILERAGAIQPKTWLDQTVFSGLAESQRENAPLFLVESLLRKLRVLKRDGFYRKSLPNPEVRVTFKGKLNSIDTIRQCLLKGVKHKIHCTYFDLTTDTIENRFIKYTIWRLLHTPGLPRPVRQQLREYWRMLASIPFNQAERFLNEIESIVRRRKLPPSRSYYVDILSLCFLIVESSTVVIKEGEDIRLSAFAINMNNLFERYIRSVLTEALQSEFAVLDGNLEKRKLFIDSDEPEITPDVLLYDKATCLVVGDVKYKDKSLPSAGDWYQIVSYTMALNAPVGVLIYSANEPATPRSFKIGDKTIWVYYYPVQSPKQQEEKLIDFFNQLLQELSVTQG